ncbi:hypothetical protein F5Y15DRAFT_277325 [Xylariaceae sp. FL0016]|nr:hypothetical protein F5Y15DRAFT_277325 [Xylariaceae sp. FL0016]
MGAFCSVDKGSNPEQHEKDFSDSPHDHSRMHHVQHLIDKMKKSTTKAPSRSQIPKDLKFQAPMRDNATTDEIEANEILGQVRKRDESTLKDKNAPALDGHFSRIAPFIRDTGLFHLASLMPKGAHLHIHFNSTLLPNALLEIAQSMDNMYIWSDRPLVNAQSFKDCKIEFSLRHLETKWDDQLNFAKGRRGTMLRDLAKSAEIQSKQDKKVFHDELGPDLFDESYLGEVQKMGDGSSVELETFREMRFQHFISKWDSKGKTKAKDLDCLKWLESKLVFSKEDADEIYQSPTPSQFRVIPHGEERARAAKAWDIFGGRTRMMKGLFVYERAFREYTRRCLEEFVRDNVQYAEIRPNFMENNKVLLDDGRALTRTEFPAGFKLPDVFPAEWYESYDKTGKPVLPSAEQFNQRFSGFWTMEIIIDEYQKFVADMQSVQGDDTRPAFCGLKVIYCTPRSFSQDQVRFRMKECILLKMHWPEYIAGFDLVGPEASPAKYPLREFREQFAGLATDCETAKVDIPLLLHCGETPDDTEQNLEYAVEVKAKRIGHGYALRTKPNMLEEMVSQKMCVETCPISNMVLGLTEYMKDHAMYELLAQKVLCTVSSDNGTLFDSTLSHDFYEVMVGHPDMDLFGWKQLAKWSIEHSCMTAVERTEALREWELRWKEFIQTVKTIDPEDMGQLPLAEPASERLAHLKRYQGFTQARDAEERREISK